MSLGEIFLDRLAGFENHPLVGETRGRGPLAAVELVRNKDRRERFPLSQGVGTYCGAACAEEGLIVRPIGDIIAFCPPLEPVTSSTLCPWCVLPNSSVATTDSRCVPGARSSGRSAIQMCVDGSGSTQGLITSACRCAISM